MPARPASAMPPARDPSDNMGAVQQAMLTLMENPREARRPRSVPNRLPADALAPDINPRRVKALLAWPKVAVWARPRLASERP